MRGGSSQRSAVSRVPFFSAGTAETVFAVDRSTIGHGILHLSSYCKEHGSRFSDVTFAFHRRVIAFSATHSVQQTLQEGV